MPELTVENLLLFAAFVAPGMVSLRVFGLLVPTERVEATSTVLTALTYSLVNFALTFWIIDIALAKSGWVRSVLLGIVVVVVPALLAILTYLLRTRTPLAKWNSDPTPTGWDYFFLQHRPCWVLFHLRNGERVGGWYGPRSRASLYPFDRDVYVQDLWRLDDEGRFIEKVPDTSGAVVRLADCDVVEFFNAEAKDVQASS